jgi:type VI secretion system Hcp family effector
MQLLSTLPLFAWFAVLSLAAPDYYRTPPVPFGPNLFLSRLLNKTLVTLTSTKSGALFSGVPVKNSPQHSTLISTFDFNISIPLSVGGGANGKSTFSSIVVSRSSVDKASPLLLQAVANNEVMSEATITMMKQDAASGAPAAGLVYKMAQGKIVGVSHHVSADGTVSERIEMVFRKIEVNYAGISDVQLQNGNVVL